MRLTIERMRTLVLVAAGLLVAALAAFLIVAHWKSRLGISEIPKRLGVDIEKEANGVTYTQSRGGHTLFKIHASKVVQLKQNERALLHDVHIELYGEDGSRVDTIDGREFEYDQKEGRAIAGGPVEISLTRPGATAAMAQDVMGKPVAGDLPKTGPLSATAKSEAETRIHVKTSGLTFDQKSGTATTGQRVEFSIPQGSGSAMGATFDSQNGRLVLEHAVELDARRGDQPVLLRAAHAEFERGDLVCEMRGASADFRKGVAKAGQARVLFRQNGSAVRFDASEGFEIATSAGAHMSAPRAILEFDEHNQPRHGHMEGGVVLDAAQNGHMDHGSAPAAELVFTSRGELERAHLERGVTLHSEQTVTLAAGQGEQHAVRDWRSPVADVDFRSIGKGRTQVASIRGIEGVVVTGQSQRGNGPVLPSRMSADQVTAFFGETEELAEIVGAGHASLEQTTATGTRQTIRGSRLDAHFASGKGDAKASQSASAMQIQNATVDGSVELTGQPAARPGQGPQPALHAFAGHAMYESAGELLHLTAQPRIEDGNLQLSADRVDVAQASGDAYAHGNVKATWLDSSNGGGAGQAGPALGGQGPAHVIASEAQLHQATNEVTFRGQARLWQEANSVAAPVIVIDRARQTLVARTTSASDPVRLVLLNAGGIANPGEKKSAGAKSPSVVRVRAGDLKYSDAERKVVLQAGANGSVIAETGAATTSSNEVQLQLVPAGSHAVRNEGAAQVDRLTAKGHVVITSTDRRGAGEQLVYTGASETYVLTGTAARPPKITDPVHGMVTGDALIFNSRDDSVRVEGDSRKTVTETTVPR